MINHKIYLHNNKNVYFFPDMKAIFCGKKQFLLSYFFLGNFNIWQSLRSDKESEAKGIFSVLLKPFLKFLQFRKFKLTENFAGVVSIIVCDN